MAEKYSKVVSVRLNERYLQMLEELRLHMISKSEFDMAEEYFSDSAIIKTAINLMYVEKIGL